MEKVTSAARSYTKNREHSLLLHQGSRAQLAPTLREIILMKILFRLFGLAFICFFTIYMVSCGQREEDEEVSPVELVAADPSTDTGTTRA